MEKSSKIILSSCRNPIYSAVFAQLSWNLQAFHSNRTTCEALHYTLHPPFIPGISTAKQTIEPSMKSPVDALWWACWNPRSSWGILDANGALRAGKSQTPSLENICQPLCLLVVTLAFSSCRTDRIPIYILMHSNAALPGIPCYFLINTGTLTDACSLPKGSHCKYKTIQPNINWESQQYLHDSQLPHQCSLRPAVIQASN